MEAEATYFFLGLWVVISTLLGVIIYPQPQLKGLYKFKRHEQGVFWAYVVSYAMLAITLGFLPNGLVLAAIWLALAAVQWSVSYITFNKSWNIKVTFWVTVAFHVVQGAALLIYINSYF